MNKEELFNSFRNNIYCRIKPSPIHGVGVFAIRDIPKGIDPFIGAPEEEYVGFTPEEIEGLDLAVIRMVKDFCFFKDGQYWCSPHGFNNLDIVYFINHSDDPNLETVGEHFFTNRVIKKGEELTDNYYTFDDIGIEPD